MRFHFVSAYSFAHHKTSSVKRLQEATYADLRRENACRRRLACTVPRQVDTTRHRTVD
jgi:hypothetical protein